MTANALDHQIPAQVRRIVIGQNQRDATGLAGVAGCAIEQILSGILARRKKRQIQRHAGSSDREFQQFAFTAIVLNCPYDRPVH